MITWVTQSKIVEYKQGWRGAINRKRKTMPFVDIRFRGRVGSIRIIICRSNHHPTMGKFFRNPRTKDKRVVRDQVMVAITTGSTACFPLTVADEIGLAIEEAREKYQSIVKVKDLEVLKW